MSNSFSDVAGRITHTGERTPINCQQFVGKYRATVLNNIDPLGQGRILVTVPDVSSIAPSSWAMPASAPNDSSTPAPGSGVWIEFEQGDPDYPIWSGGFVGSALPNEVPIASKLSPPGVPQRTIGTPLQHSITVSDSPATGIMMKTPGTAMITITDAGGIIITNGTAAITMQGPNITIVGNVVVI